MMAARTTPRTLTPLRLIGHASGQDLRTVIVDGQVRMRDRTVPGVDDATIMDAAADALMASWE